VPRLNWLDPRNSRHILRILQEAFSNILKHTRANEIRVPTGARDDRVWVSITDNGPGFDLEEARPEARPRGGRSLTNQQRRAAELGGEVSLESPASGTRLLLLLPQEQLHARTLA
jgi:signal transduction histidine kinase